MHRDSEADFERFVHERGSALLRTAHLLTGDQGQAQDLLQDVLEKVFLRWDSVRTKDEPVAYVRRCLVNASTNRWRRLRARVREVTWHAGVDVVAADPMRSVDLRDELDRVLAQLTQQQRTVLVLRYWEDMSEADTARLLGCSVGTVKSQASRGLAKLRRLLDTQTAVPASPSSASTSLTSPQTPLNWAQQ